MQDFAESFLQLAGASAKASKRVPMGPRTLHLGLVNDYSDLATDTMRLLPKEGRVSRVLAKIECVLQSRWLGADMANGLRGDLVWLTCTSFHKIGRSGFSSLVLPVEVQGTHISQEMILVLQFYKRVLRNWLPVPISIHVPKTAHGVLYTFAECSKGPSGCIGGWGLFLLLPSGERLQLASVIPTVFTQSLKPRDTQIMAYELSVIPAALIAARHLLPSYMILFVDNLSGACAIAKGTAKSPDLQGIVTAIHYTPVRLGLKWWIEWVPSAQNLADHPSRAPDEYDPLPFPDFLLHHSNYNILLDSIDTAIAGSGPHPAPL